MMIGSYLLDENGNIVKNLYQWDVNQKLIIETHDITIAPKIHFCNKNSEKALVVKSTLSDNKIIANIPNILLQEPYNVIAYIYLENNGSGKTVRTIEITLRKRVKPDNYEYVDNVEVVYLADLIRSVESLKNQIITDKENGVFNGAKGNDGKSAYESALEGGYKGTEIEFYTLLASLNNVATDSEADEFLFGTA